MNAETLERLVAEIAPLLVGRWWGRIFPLTRFELAVDLRLPDSKYLFVSIEPAAPRIYLITRRLRDIERAALNFSPFLLGLRKHLSGAEIISVEKIPGERALKFGLTGENEIGETGEHSLIVQLTGRSSNLFFLNDKGVILDSARESHGAGQETGSVYAPPPRPEGIAAKPQGHVFQQGELPTLSETLDTHYAERDAEKTFNARAGSARAKVKQSLTRSEKLAAKLRKDLDDHGDPEEWKKFGDLLLASIATARRDDDHFYVTDFYDEALPELAIPAEKGLSLTEAAEVFFKRYTRSRNARVEIAKRLEIAEAEIERLKSEQERVEAAISLRDLSLLDEFAGAKQTAASPREKKKSTDFKGARYFISSDGFEILVGKASKDNDFLTFRVARSLDTWMHAADYPGSHVVISNKSKQEIPQKTLLEAAALAAFYSNAREQPKVAVHYTQRKFVNKPKGAAPGLVSLSSFKTLLVEPGFGDVQKKEPH